MGSEFKMGDSDKQIGRNTTEQSGGGSDLSARILDRISVLHEDVKKDINEVKIKNQQLTDCINTFKDEIKTSFSKVDEEFTKFKNEIFALKKENKVLKKSLFLLQSSLEESIQHSIYNKIKILNVPNHPNIQIFEILQRISIVIGFDFSKEKLGDFYRLKSKQNTNFAPPILFNFLRNNDKHEFMNCYRKFLKNKKLTLDQIINDSPAEVNPSNVLYISEHLSPLNYKIFKLAKALKSQGKIKFVWVRNNKVLVRVEESAPSVWLKSENDLLQYMDSALSHTFSGDSENGDEEKSDSSTMSLRKKRKIKLSVSKRSEPFLRPKPLKNPQDI